MNEETLELFSTFLNDYTKDTLYRDMAMKEQNRHLARIASALEKLSGGTTLSNHNERYEQKLEADKQSETPVSITYWVDTEYKCFGFVEDNGLEQYSDDIPSSFRISTEREYTKFTKRFSGYPLTLTEYLSKLSGGEKVEEVKELETQTYTHDNLKALCLSKSREDVANKPKLKALLKEFGAAKVLDVKSKEDLTTIITRINAGEF